LITAAVTVTLGIIPYFINNFLLFGNPFLSPVYVSGHLELAQQITSATGLTLFARIQQLTTLFFAKGNPYSQLPTTSNWPENLYHALFYVNMPVKLALFQVCPLLIIPLFAAIPFVARKLASFKKGAVRLKIDTKHAIAFTFFVYLVAHLIIYAPIQESGFGLDMRFFLPLYIPLLFFTLASIREVLVHVGHIERAFAAAWTVWIIFVGSLLVYAALFVPAIRGRIGGLGFPFIGTLGVVTAVLMTSFVPYFVGYRKRVKELAIMVGFATFVSSYWLVIATWVWQKTPIDMPWISVPRSAMMLPVMEVIHRIMVSIVIS
jgi:hypothetical protein